MVNLKGMADAASSGASASNSLRSTQRQVDNGSGIMRCRDGHMCENFSVCVENPLDEGNYYCDCEATSSDSDAKFSGLKCEHEATTYCLHSPWHGQVSESFCTNNGVCKQLVNADDNVHYGCDCPSGYTGDYCQFIEGSVPKNWPTKPNPYADIEKKENGAIAGVIIGIMIIVACAVLYAVRTKYKNDAAKKVTKELDGDEAMLASPTPSGEGEDLALAASMDLDADGGMLQDAVKEKLENGTAAAQDENVEDQDEDKDDDEDFITEVI